MSKNTCTAVNVPAYLECQICFDSWRQPVQLLKCGHIFCSHCASANGTRCFICRSEVTGTQEPDAKIMASAAAVPVVCSSCGWRGTRKESECHRCDSRMTHSSYMRYPQLSDEERIRMIQEQARAAAAGAPVTATVTATAAVVGEDGAPQAQYERRDVYTAIPM